jgi:hypothetical protein
MSRFVIFQKCSRWRNLFNRQYGLHLMAGFGLAINLTSCGGVTEVDVLGGGGGTTSDEGQVVAMVKENKSLGEASPSTVAKAFEPRYRVQSHPILQTNRYLYSSGKTNGDIRRFGALNAPEILTSNTLSPDALAKSSSFVREPGGRLVSGSGDVLEPLTPFPWPPPRPSVSFTFDNQKTGFERSKPMTLGEVNRSMMAGLLRLGYSEKAYFGVPGGYAVVTRLEKIKPDGRSESGETRWRLTIPGRYDFWYWSFYKSLLTGSEGHFRIVVLVVTDRLIKSNEDDATPKQAMDWLTSGANRLPDHVARLHYDRSHRVTALIYEFERKDIENKVRGPIGPPSRLSAMVHLTKSGILPLVEKQR